MSTQCTFVDIGGDRKRCIHTGCGRVMRSPHPADKCHAPCRSPAAKAEREKQRLKAISEADMPTVARVMVASMVERNEQAITKGRRPRPIRSELRVLEILTTRCANRVKPCDYCIIPKGCGNPKAACENIACATVACPLGGGEHRHDAVAPGLRA